MADLKISQLTAITTLTPATDVLPVVDVTGTTKKITTNQILGAGGTATLASATITGNLTVDTNTLFVDSANNRVGIGTATPTAALDILGAFGTSTGAAVIRNNSAANASNISQVQFFAANSFAGSEQVASIHGSNPNAAANNGGALVFSTSLNGTGTTPTERYRIGNDGTATWSVGGSTAMTLNSTGLGVGVSPSAWNSSYKAIQFGSGGAVSGHTSSSLPWFVASSNAFINSAGDWKYINNGYATRYLARGDDGSQSWSTSASGSAGGTITFTQAMTLDASGNLLVGTTTNTNGSRVFARGTGGATTLAIQSSTGDTANPGLLVGKFDNDSTTSQILVRFTINNNAAGSGQITANGANAAAFGTFSDSRLKENIANIPSQLEKIVSLRPVEFDFKNGSGHQIGFVAQEMQEVYPDVVGEQDGFLTITGWSKTEARLVSAIKELAAKVQALEAKLA
jgi:hypothetical protein